MLLRHADIFICMDIAKLSNLNWDPDEGFKGLQQMLDSGQRCVEGVPNVACDSNCSVWSLSISGGTYIFSNRPECNTGVMSVPGSHEVLSWLQTQNKHDLATDRKNRGLLVQKRIKRIALQRDGSSLYGSYERDGTAYSSTCLDPQWPPVMILADHAQFKVHKSYDATRMTDSNGGVRRVHDPSLRMSPAIIYIKNVERDDNHVAGLKFLLNNNDPKRDIDFAMTGAIIAGAFTLGLGAIPAYLGVRAYNDKIIEDELNATRGTLNIGFMGELV